MRAPPRAETAPSAHPAPYQALMSRLLCQPLIKESTVLALGIEMLGRELAHRGIA